MFHFFSSKVVNSLNLFLFVDVIGYLYRVGLAALYGFFTLKFSIPPFTY